MIKYIAYCRKSTDESDRQILSIEAQVAELEEFAAKLGKAQSSAKSGTKNLKSSNPKGSLHDLWSLYKKFELSIK